MATLDRDSHFPKCSPLAGSQDRLLENQVQAQYGVILEVRLVDCTEYMTACDNI